MPPAFRYAPCIYLSELIRPERVPVAMIIEQMDISVAGQDKEQLTRALLSLLRETETVQGCVCCGLFLGLPSEDVLHVETHWERERDLLRYLQSDTYKKFLLLMELGAAAPVVNFYSVEETQGLELVWTTRKNQVEQLSSFEE